MERDDLLIKKMRQGDEAAFEMFVRKYYRDILNFCHYHCIDKAYAEDITQETFVRFFSKLSDYRNQGKPKNYLYKIAGNLCRDYVKKKREIPMEEAELINSLGAAGLEDENVLDKIVMEQALLLLPDELRDVVVLYYFQQLKVSEIAEILQISLPLAKYRLRRAKLQLRKILGKDGGYEFGRKTDGL